jgi:ankyrin repeat protein
MLRLIVAGQRCPKGPSGPDDDPLVRRGCSLTGRGYTLIFGTAGDAHEQSTLDHRTEKQLRLQYGGRNGHTSLARAVKAGDTQAVRSLIWFGDDVHATVAGVIQSTCAGLAAMHGHIECLRVLAVAGANLNKATTCGVTPAYISCQNGDVELLRFLISAGANVNHARKNGATPCLMACEGGHVDCLALLVASGADVNAKTDEGVTPAHLAALKGATDALKSLKVAGANLNQPDRRGLTPLHAAKAGKHKSCVMFLETESLS